VKLEAERVVEDLIKKVLPPQVKELQTRRVVEELGTRAIK